MEDGKKFFNYVVWLIFLSCWYQSSTAERSPSVLRGGLVYSEESHEGPVYLNQNFYSFARTTDTQILLKTAQLSSDLTNLYVTKCSEISEAAKSFNRKLALFQLEKEMASDKAYNPYELVVSDESDYIGHAPSVCHRMGARLPEIRDGRSREKVRQAAIEANITKIYAGISWDKQTDTFRFRSDLSSAGIEPQPWEAVYYGGDYRGQEHRAGYTNSHIMDMAHRFPMIYSNPKNDFRIKLADVGEVWQLSKILCEKLKPTPIQRLTQDESASPLIQLADHSCRRDMPSLVATTKMLLGQIQQITNLNITIKQDPPNPAIFMPKFVEIDEGYTLVSHDAQKRHADNDAADNNPAHVEIVNKIVKAVALSEPPKWMTGSDVEMIYQLHYIFTSQNNSMSFEEWLDSELHQRTFLISVIESLSDIQIEKSYDSVLFYEIFNNSLTHLDQNDSYNHLIDTRIYNIFLSIIRENQTIFICEKENPVKRFTTMLNNKQSILTLWPNIEVRKYNKNLRNKRSIPLWATTMGVTGGINVVTSIFTGDAPLSWFGEIIGSIFGLQTSKESQQQLKLLQQTAATVDKLAINQKDLIIAINAANERVTKYTKYVLSSHRATSVKLMEQDLRAMIRHLHVLIEATLQKFANILVAAMSEVISPYAITAGEIKKIAHEVTTTKKIEISTDPRDYRMKAVIANNSLSIIFETPILDQSQLYHFYRVKPMPIFIQNRTFMPEIDAEYIAISHSGSEYISISTDEFSRCTNNPRKCYVTNPVIPLTSDAVCTMVTYRDMKMMCPLIETKIPPSPTMHIKDNKVIYSVPEETTMFARCNNHDTFTPDQASFKITGMGQIAFRSSCTITLPDGSHFKTPTLYPSENIKELKLYDLLNIQPVMTNVTLRFLPPPQLEEVVPVSLSFDDISLPSMEDLKLETFHPVRIIPFIIRLGFTIVVILAIIAVCYSCRYTILQCCCSFCCNPPTNYTNADRYSPRENEERMQEINERLMALNQRPCNTYEPGNWSRWKSNSSYAINSISNSMADLRNRIFRTPSMPNVATRDDVETGLLNDGVKSRAASTLSLTPISDQIKINNDRVKFVYKPILPILKRPLETVEEPEDRYKSSISVRFNPKEMGPHEPSRPSAPSADSEDEERPNKRNKNDDRLI